MLNINPIICNDPKKTRRSFVESTPSESTKLYMLRNCHDSYNHNMMHRFALVQYILYLLLVDHNNFNNKVKREINCV